MKMLAVVYIVMPLIGILLNIWFDVLFKSGKVKKWEENDF